MNYLIQLIDLNLYFAEKLCFESFNYQIHAGERIALIGDNGSGKSSMLKIIKKLMQPSDGFVHHSDAIKIAYIPQLIHGYDQKSGAEKFNLALTEALVQSPSILILDEPTNHLDINNRRSLIRLLNQYQGTLILASHDVNLLRSTEYCFWYFNQQKIEIFQGYFDHFQQKKLMQINAIEREIGQLNHQKKVQHHALMKEQQRAKNARIKGEKSIRKSKWPTIVSKTKVLRALETSGKKKKSIFEHKEHLIKQMHELSTEEEITPQFELPMSFTTTKSLVTICDGLIAYDKKIILSSININLTGQNRLALYGANGSGKSTLLKAIMSDPSIRTEGLWALPHPKDIGYLDQHYQQLQANDSVFDTIQKSRPDWTYSEIRKHLNNFLFSKNHHINLHVSLLSGGEKARLILALIAAKPPKLLILDELTNNLDFKTRNHVITLLNKYPGPFIVISHDEDFLAQIGVTTTYSL